MGKYVIDETTLTGIGDAIREKDGTTEGIDPSDMKTRIQAIDTQEDLDAELATQDNLIAQIMTELEGKAAGGGDEIPTCTVIITCSDNLSGGASMLVSAVVVDDDGSIGYCSKSGPTLPFTIENVVCNSLVTIRPGYVAYEILQNATKINGGDMPGYHFEITAGKGETATIDMTTD